MIGVERDQRVLLSSLGSRYSWGAGTLSDAVERWPGGPFDCSGFAQSALRELGHLRGDAWYDKSAHDLANACDPVEPDRYELGDLAFYKGGKLITHVTVYLGGGMTIGCNGGGSRTRGNNPKACVQVRPVGYRNDFLVMGRLKSRHRPTSW